MTSFLEKLRANRDFILMAELGALLHDVGKLDERWPKQEGDKYEHQAATLGASACNVDFRGFLNRNLCDPGLFNAVSQASFASINDFIRHHHETDGKGPLRQLIRLADLWSSSEDRAIPPGVPQEQEDRERGPCLFLSDPFGNEKVVDRAGLRTYREQIEQALEECAKAHQLGADFAACAIKEAKAILRESGTIASTIRPSNDVTLFDHSFSTASIFKALLNQWILGKEVTSKQPFGTSLRDRLGLLTVIFDMNVLYEQAEKIGDLKGRRMALDSIQDNLRDLMETTYAAGNQIYQEPGISCFLVPVQFSEEAGKQELEELLESFLEAQCKREGVLMPFAFRTAVARRVHEELPKILGAARGADLPSNRWLVRHLDEEWNKAPQNAEICPLCGLLPAVAPPGRPKGRRLCAPCRDLRGKGQKSRSDRPGTVWIDEIADPDNGRVALVTIEVPLDWWLREDGMLRTQQYKFTGADIYSKTPSYERLRRIWTATGSYLGEFLESVCGDLEDLKRIRPVLSFAGGRLPEREQFYAVEGPETAELYLFADGTWRSVTRLRHPEAWQPGVGVTLREDRPGGGEIQATIQALEEETYRPFAVADRAPDRVAVVLPARAGRPAARRALELFRRHFPKAQGKLPVAIGALYASCKYPLSFLLRAAIDMRKYLRQHANGLQSGEVIAATPSEAGFPVHIEIASAAVPEDRVRFPVDTCLGDNRTGMLNWPDSYYTRYPVTATNGLPVRTEALGRAMIGGSEYDPVPVTCLKPGDRVGLLYGSFDFEFLDTPARRHYVCASRSVTGFVNIEERARENRPYTVYHLELLDRIEGIVRRTGGMTDTRLIGVCNLLASRLEDWGVERGDDQAAGAYREFVRDVLDKEFDLKPEDRSFMLKAVMSGLFFDWVEIFYSIEKQKIGRE